MNTIAGAFLFFREVFMDSEIFEKLPPTKLFFRLAIPLMIIMAFGLSLLYHAQSVQFLR